VRVGYTIAGAFRRERNALPGTIDELRVLLRRVERGELGALEAGETICAAALGRPCGQWPWLWLLWAALTDRCAGGTDPRGQAEEDIRRAAGEWLTLSDDEADWRPYFDRWLRAITGSPAGSGTLEGFAAKVRRTQPPSGPPRQPGSVGD